MHRELHDGNKDGLVPLESLDLRHCGTFSEMLQAMSHTAFGGRELGEAFHVLKAMVSDPDCTVVMTLSGAMTVGKMGRIVCDMIEFGMVNVIVSTGAIMAHGLSEATGGVHYKHDPNIPDNQLYEWGYNRVYDTLEMEANLCDTERFVSETLSSMSDSEPTCSSAINRELGRRLVQAGQMPSILGCAHQKNVPVFIPAFTDSEVGLDVATHVLKQAGIASSCPDLGSLLSIPPLYNPYLDLYDYAKRAHSAKRLGIFTIGGGVPRNWAQQVGPFVDIINMRLGTSYDVPRFTYAVRICPEPVNWGGLSGCTYSEGVSWGKFLSPEEGGRFAEVRSDATIAWPILIRGVMESLGFVDSSPLNAHGG
ncbi:MAG: deoxyhypusine synthase family protein [Planctomycetota bacterium]|nr:deoxyhypusine synthase family protein [Planctomycetota bacterium]MDA1141078.1 deoxyhypusine synthase family protein [Planctomycetota bacterium]